MLGIGDRTRWRKSNFLEKIARAHEIQAGDESPAEWDVGNQRFRIKWGNGHFLGQGGARKCWKKCCGKQHWTEKRNKTGCWE